MAKEVGFEFQSLVGTLKTPVTQLQETGFGTFQSLVGTLKTRDFVGLFDEVTRFQSLVGTLKTRIMPLRPP